jgi:hypothetical protein
MLTWLELLFFISLLAWVMIKTHQIRVKGLHKLVYVFVIKNELKLEDFVATNVS